MNKLLQYVAECDDTPSIVVILEGDVQEAVTEVEESGVVVDQVFDDIQSANNAIDSLYRIASVIKDNVTEDGNTATVQSLAEIAIEQVYDSLNMRLPQTLSMEADFLEGAKAVATKIKEHAVRIMAAIVEAFRKAVDWISDYLKKVTGAAVRLENKAKELNKKLGQLSSEPKNVTFKDMNLARALSKGEDLSQRYVELRDLTSKAFEISWRGEHVTLLNQIIEKFIAEESKDITAVMKLVLRIPDVLEKTYGGIFSNNAEAINITDEYSRDDTNTYTTGFLPGGYVGILMLPIGLDALRHLNFVIRRDEEAVSSDAGDGTMKTMSLLQTKLLVETAGVICSTIRVFHDFESKLKQTSLKLTKAVDALKKTSAEMDKGHREVLGAIAIMAPYLTRGIHSRVFGFATSCTNNVLRYCEKSLEQYEDK